MNDNITQNNNQENSDKIGLYNRHVAITLDLNCAVVYSKVNKAETDYFDGRFWACGTVREWSERLPELNESQIRRAFNLLEKAGFVVTGNYNKTAYDRTKWYSTAPFPELVRK